MSHKRKREDDGVQALASADQPTTRGNSRQQRSERRSKKPKKSQDATATTDEVDTVANRHPTPLEGPPQSPSRQEIPQRRAKKPKVPNTHTHTKSEPATTTETATRFIVFVGNLPFDATVDQVTQHFSKLGPASVRLSTDKATGKCRGFAFLEFESYDKMKTCLKLYHHSIFGAGPADGDSAGAETGGKRDKKKGRRINVELTAGGGGKNSTGRKEKIKAKNQKLDEERSRRRAHEQKAARAQKASAKAAALGSGANAIETSAPPATEDHGSIHPSRVGRVKA